jgi:peptide deformylase
MNIIFAPNELLNRHCRPNKTLNFNVLAEMFALMDLHKGMGLAAPQVGILERFFITSWGQVFVDPLVYPERQFGKEEGPEGCLSLPGQAFMVDRWRVVTVGGTRYSGLAAVVVQHELDHLDGILISERGKPFSGSLLESSPSTPQSA